MKKLISVLLATLLLVSCSAAFAEAAEAVAIADPASSFNVTIVLPEGAQITDTTAKDDYAMTLIDFLADLGDEDTFDYTVIIAPTELYEGSMEDMTDEQIREIADICVQDLDDPTYEIKTLENGNKVIVYEDKGEEFDCLVFTSIHNGYMVQVAALAVDFGDSEALVRDNVTKLAESLTYIEVPAAE